MTSISADLYYRVEFILTSKEDGSQLDVTLYNRSTSVSDDFDSKPLLKGLVGFGSTHSEWLPNPSGGSVVIDNSPGSYDFERRFSDILDRYHIVGQSVVVGDYLAEVGGAASTGSFTDRFTGTVRSVSISPSSKEIIIQVSARDIPLRVISKVLDNQELTTLPIGSIGVTLPIVFGLADVPAYLIYGGSTTLAQYAYATTFGGISSTRAFLLDDADEIFIKDDKGFHQAITSAPDQDVPVYEVVQTTPDPWNSIKLGTPKIIRTITPTDTYLVTQAEVKIYTGSVTSYDGDEKVKIGLSRGGSSGSPEREVASFTRPITDFPSNSTLYTASGCFDVPVVMSNTEIWYLTIELLEADAVHIYLATNITTEDVIYSIYAAELDDISTPGLSEVNELGLGHAAVHVTQRTATNGPEPSLNNLDMVVRAGGLIDNDYGDATGTANLLIERPIDALKCITSEWDGSDWNISAQFDTTLFTETHSLSDSGIYQRYIQGASVGRVTLKDLLNQICAAGLVRLVNLEDGNFGFWGYGGTSETSKVFDDENCEIIKHEILPLTSTVNSAIIKYSRKYLNTVLVDLQPILRGSQYGKYFDSEKGGATVTEWNAGVRDDITDLPKDLFGELPSIDRVSEFISDDFTAWANLLYYLGKYRTPTEYVICRVPYEQARELRNMEIVEFIHPDLPSFFGSTSKAIPPTYGGDPSDLLDGFYLKRAKRVRAQIEGKTYKFGRDEYPLIELTCRILNNTPYDPT